MAKDDYDVVLYKILVYLYACMKRTVIFDQDVFDAAIRRKDLNEQYLVDILRMMKSEGLIENVKIIGTWGPDHILVSDFSEITITAEGIRYLKENSTMQRVKNALIESKDIIASLIGLVHL